MDTSLNMMQVQHVHQLAPKYLFNHLIISIFLIHVSSSCCETRSKQQNLVYKKFNHMVTGKLKNFTWIYFCLMRHKNTLAVLQWSLFGTLIRHERHTALIALGYIKMQQDQSWPNV
jgi:hypothetical protein